nr:putative concanavalin A-like lectin/glucanase domain-containing protein [Tanacetum cinerariifolium]
MKPRLHSSPTFYAFTVILATVIRFPAICCQNARPYDDCGQRIQCGDINLEYPFWGAGRPQYCGHPNFQLACQSNVPMLLYVNYRVLENPDTSIQTIKVARNDLWSTLCPPSFYNTTYNSTLFNGDNLNQENVSLYYACDTSLLVPQPLDFLAQCDNHIEMPVNQTSANILGSTGATSNDLQSALKAGFNLQWTVFNNECDDSIFQTPPFHRFSSRTSRAESQLLQSGQQVWMMDKFTVKDKVEMLEPFDLSGNIGFPEHYFFVAYKRTWVNSRIQNHSPHRFRGYSLVDPGELRDPGSNNASRTVWIEYTNYLKSLPVCDCWSS